MKKIKFYNILNKKGNLSFYVESKDEYDEPKNVYFEYDKHIKLFNDQILYLIATLCGEQYEKVDIDLDITKEMKMNFESFTKAKLKANVVDFVKIPNRVNYKNYMLSFSGGFDSLAAMYLLPKKVKMISISFGEWFKRESDFFNRFKTHVVNTNLRRKDIRLDKNSWTFMGCAQIIYCDYLKAKYNIFGTILEASKAQFKKNSYSFDEIEKEPFKYLGLKDYKLMNGLTTIGTTLLTLHYAKKYLNDSLISLAAPHHEKRYRKQIILDILIDKYKYDVDFEHVKPVENKIEWGKQLSLDFLIPYIIKYGGIDVASSIVSNIPNELIDLVKNMRLTFYEKINTCFFNGSAFPYDDFKKYAFNKFCEANIMLYDETDFEEYRTIINYLDKYYN